MRYTKTALMELTKKYNNVLRKCALLNALVFTGVLASGAVHASVITEHQTDVASVNGDTYEGIEYAGDGAAIKNTIGSTITDATFKNNATGSCGGALFINANGQTTDITNTKFIGNSAVGGADADSGAITLVKGILNITGGEFTGNTARVGGAIYTYTAKSPNWSKIVIDGTTFTGNVSNGSHNTESGGGAIFNVAYGTSNGGDAGMTIKNATFTGNQVTGENINGGGAINLGSASKTDILNTTFEGNESSSVGGAIATRFSGTHFGNKPDQKDGKLTIENSTFTGNHADTNGGAIFNTFYHSTDGGDGVLIKNTTFSNNSASENGGAIYNSEEADLSGNKSSMVFSGTTEFTGNTAGDEESHINGYGGAIMNATDMIFEGNAVFEGNEAIGGSGGAIANENRMGPTGTITFKGTADFTGNIAGNNGGALETMGTVNFKKKATFTGNSAAYGGAITLVNTGANVTFDDDAEFTDNTATDFGGAIYTYGNTLTFNKKATFSNNTADGEKNDIYSNSTIIFNGDTILDGGIINYGNNAEVIFGENSTLKINMDGSKVISGTDGTIDGTTSLVLGSGADGSSFIMEGNKDTFTFAENNLYTIDLQDDDITYLVSKKSVEEITEMLAEEGVSKQDAQIIAGVTDADGDNPIVSSITEDVQQGNFQEAAQTAEELAPTTAKHVMGVALNVNNILSNIADGRIATLGRAGGDTFKGGSAWIQGLYGYAKQDSSASTAGFKADTTGLAMGVDGKINDATTVGIGYGYAKTDADSAGRDIDVDGHNFFVYGSYQPDAWYVKTMLAYGLNKYEEKKSPAGTLMKAKYDVNTYAVNVMTGYDLPNGFTPEGGFRYVLIDQESYGDGTQRVSTKNDDVLTAVMGIKYTKDFKADEWTLKPFARLAATYDVLSDNAIANVSIGGGSYQIVGKRLNRFGMETGLGLTGSIRDWDFTVEYNGGFRKDYQNHTGLLRAKYHF